MTIELEEHASSPGTPSANIVRLYAKADGRLYGKDDAGTEFALSLTLPVSIANGGTGQATAALAFAALSPMTTKGDLTTYSTTPGRRAVGSNGQVLTADSTAADGVAWATPSAAPSFNPSTAATIFDEFASGTEDTDEFAAYCWRVDVSGTGSSFSRLTGVAGHPGIARLSGGTVATARSCIHLGDTGLHFMILGSGAIVCEMVMRLGATLLSMGSAQVGLGTSFAATTDNSDGVYFEITTTDTNWFLVSRVGNVSTRRDTGVAFSNNAWVRFRFTVNAGATSIQANVNGSDVGAAVTTNIPTAVGLSPFVKTVGLAAGVANSWDIDYFYLTQTFSTPR